MLTHRWHAVAESQIHWERDALDYLRQHLPHVETTRAWANGEFVSLDGHLSEADVIVITARGMFLVEIKSRPGEVSGDLQDLVWREGGPRVSRPQPDDPHEHEGEAAVGALGEHPNPAI